MTAVVSENDSDKKYTKKIDVSIVSCAEYDHAVLVAAIEKSLELLGGVDKCIPKNSKVLLKVNLLMTAPIEKAVATNPAVVKAVLEICRRQECKIYLGDSPGFQSAESSYKYYGLDVMAKEYGAELADLSDSKEYLSPDAKVMKHFRLPKLLDEIDVLINLPKLKTHTMAQYTGAIKNLFGLNNGLSKSDLHLKFSDKELFFGMLADLYMLVKPKLTIMDAVVALEGNGPGTGGDPKKVGKILASTDALALDIVASRIIALELKDNPVIAQARALNPVEPVVVGEKLEVIKDFKHITHYNSLFRIVPKWFMKLVRDMRNPRPVIMLNCVGCGTCAKVCPAKTIAIVEGKARINYKNCIRCYCCHEMCPHKAIEINSKFWRRKK
jgi:uncharacterized protein (DUF362 family)/Pyruvate/2-oxoacid:ferredoxin oxidoreductase delta subunit